LCEAQGLLRSFLGRVVVAIAKEARVPWKSCVKHKEGYAPSLEGLLLPLQKKHKSALAHPKGDEGYAVSLEGLFFLGRVVVASAKEARVPWKARFFKEGLLLPLHALASTRPRSPKGLCEARVPWKALAALLRLLEGA